jgi:hypothetical protein
MLLILYVVCVERFWLSDCYKSARLNKNMATGYQMVACVAMEQSGQGSLSSYAAYLRMGRVPRANRMLISR